MIHETFIKVIRMAVQFIKVLYWEDIGMNLFQINNEKINN